MIGDRIKERRIELGLTQEDLARKMGYKSKSTINKIELGINDVNQSKIVQFAEALHTSVAYLMGMDSHAEPSHDVEFDKESIIKAMEKAGIMPRIVAYMDSFAMLTEQNQRIVEGLTNSLLESQGDSSNED